MRSALLALGLMVLSLVSHSAAAGSLPGTSALLAGFGVALGLSYALGSRRRSFGWLVGYLMAGQLLMHVTIVAVGHHGVSFLPDVGMLVAHVIAAVAAAGMFAFGEAAIARWVRAAARMLGVRELFLPNVELSTHRANAHSGSLVNSRDVGSSISYRGPPASMWVPTYS